MKNENQKNKNLENRTQTQPTGRKFRVTITETLKRTVTVH